MPTPLAPTPTAVWKNGGGVTREIVASPEGAPLDAFDWRVSLADVSADGPFSSFPGVDRTLTVVEGAGMDLMVGGEHHIVGSMQMPGDLVDGGFLQVHDHGFGAGIFQVTDLCRVPDESCHGVAAVG